MCFRRGFSEQSQRHSTHLLRACSSSLATPAPCITSVTFTARFSSTAAALAPCCANRYTFSLAEQVVTLLRWRRRRTCRSSCTISALAELAAQCRGDQPIALNTVTSEPLWWGGQECVAVANGCACVV
jgi:hypothetical protein